MPDGTFDVSVLTPESQLLAAEARAIVLRSSEGELTVLDGHTPLVTDVVPGDVRVDVADGDPVHVAVHGGYLQVETTQGTEPASGRTTRATLLAGTAELADEIDVARAERARTEAEARVEELRQQAGRSGGPGTGAAASAGEQSEGGVTAPEDLALAEAEASLRRAEVRLEVAGARS
ncbi:MAG: ATP synthase F1 subunit epsilon [Acidimicrobiales bacterium]